MMTDKVCIVTGGASGIGRAIAVEMSKQDAGAVVIADVNETAANETVRLVTEHGADSIFVRCDLRKPQEIRELIDGTAERFGSLDVLNNNAGVIETAFMEKPTIETMPEEIWDAVYEINLRAVWLTISTARHLRRSTRGPNIINAASTSSFVGSPLGSAYCSTKGAVVQLTKVSAVELARGSVVTATARDQRIRR